MNSRKPHRHTLIGVLKLKTKRRNEENRLGTGFVPPHLAHPAGVMSSWPTQGTSGCRMSLPKWSDALPRAHTPHFLIHLPVSTRGLWQTVLWRAFRY